MIARCIQSTLTGLPQSAQDAVHEKVIDILESFPTWIDFYENTGQIQFPKIDVDVEGLDRETWNRLVEVSHSVLRVDFDLLDILVGLRKRCIGAKAPREALHYTS